jgi:hypothetical protein
MLQIEVSPVAPRTGRRWTFASGGVSALEKVVHPAFLFPPGAERRRANALRSMTSTSVDRLRRAVLLGRLSVDVPVGGVRTLSEIAINPPKCHTARASNVASRPIGAGTLVSETGRS